MKHIVRLSIASLAIAIAGVRLLGGAVTYSFSGTLTDIRDNGAGFSFGEQFDSTYVHDDSPQVGSLIEPGRMLYLGGPLSVSVAGSTLAGPASSELQVFNNWTSLVGGYDNDDGYFVSTWDYDATGGFLIQFDLWDFTGTTLSSLAMPSQSQVQSFAGNGRMFIRRFENGKEVGLAGGTFNAFSVVSSVPDAGSTLALIAPMLGLLAVGMKRRA